MASVEERWVKACHRPEVLMGSVDHRLDFGLSFPGLWRGKSNFAPVRAALLQKLLGDDWYQRIYSDPKAIWLSPATFKKWKALTQIRQTIQNNIARWLKNPDRIGKLSAVGWAKLLQAAYDFEMNDLFHRLWQRCWESRKHFPWSPDQQALLFQVY